MGCGEIKVSGQKGNHVGSVIGHVVAGLSCKGRGQKHVVFWFQLAHVGVRGRSCLLFLGLDTTLMGKSPKCWIYLGTYLSPGEMASAVQ